MKSIAIQALAIAGILTISMAKISFGACPEMKDIEHWSAADFFDEYGTDVTDSWTYEHRFLGMDKGLMKMRSVIKSILNLDIKCGDLGEIYPFKEENKLGIYDGNTQFNGLDTNYIPIFEEWISVPRTDSDTLRLALLWMDWDIPADYFYVCVDSTNLPAFYKLAAVARPKLSFVYDSMSFFSRVSHWANIFEITFRAEGGFVVGDLYDFTGYEEDPVAHTGDVVVKGYDFLNEVVFNDRSGCPDPCLKNPCLSFCYCDSADIYFDPICGKCDPCNFYYGNPWKNNWFCECILIKPAPPKCLDVCKSNPSADGCVCSASYKTSLMVTKTEAEATAY
jgi:hypothetical protein